MTTKTTIKKMNSQVASMASALDVPGLKNLLMNKSVDCNGQMTQAGKRQDRFHCRQLRSKRKQCFVGRSLMDRSASMAAYSHQDSAAGLNEAKAWSFGLPPPIRASL
jgi:hypothetical protein